MDDVATLKRFKAELKAPFPFIADPDNKVVALYDVKKPVISIAGRYTFVVGPDMKILKTQEGSDAMEPGAAVQACELRPAKPAKK